MRTGPKSTVDGSPLVLRGSRRRELAVARFALDYVRVPRGHGVRKPLRLRPWQRDLIASTWDVKPRPRLAGWMLPRGQGKSSHDAAGGRDRLGAGTPPRWSGFGGTAADWRARRGHLCQAVDRDGSLLDVGCANDHLLEHLVAPGGRLLASSYVPARDRSRHADRLLADLGFRVDGVTHPAPVPGRPHPPSAWIQRDPDPPPG